MMACCPMNVNMYNIPATPLVLVMHTHRHTHTHTPQPPLQSREVRDSLSAGARLIFQRLTMQHRLEKVSISGLLRRELISAEEAEGHRKEADEAFDRFRRDSRLNRGIDS